MQYLDRLIGHLASTASQKNQQTTVVLLPSTAGPEKSWQSSHSRHDIGMHVSHRRHAPLHEQRASSYADHPQRRTSTPSTLMLPVCYNSALSCAEATGNCSGRGYCYNKYSSRDERASSDCFACKCSETVIKDDGSVQKVWWGGSACEKRNIATPFFQIAAITILLTGAIAAAIGLLFSLGQEKLPSVIGAGVGPMRPQK